MQHSNWVAIYRTLDGRRLVIFNDSLCHLVGEFIFRLHTEVRVRRCESAIARFREHIRASPLILIDLSIESCVVWVARHAGLHCAHVAAIFWVPFKHTK